jgi:hypothetical protein
MMNFSENTYSCGVQQLIHILCTYTIVVCNLLGQNYYVPPFMANRITLQALVLTYRLILYHSWM